MDAQDAILVAGVSKAYRIWRDPAARLKFPFLEAGVGLFPPRSAIGQRLSARADRYYHDFFALRDVSFSVRQGASMGIVGRNGSGKSTLLQVIAGTLRPTNGSVHVNGRVAALLELGSGFNPEFTGRENVYLNAAVLGLSRTETDERFDQIAAFADIGDFLEQPVKTYSSGMTVRLAFAVCAHVDARILIIDEALGVGDARFQLKCARTIDRFIEEGRTLLFVSHDLSTVNRLCTSACLLERGHMLAIHLPRTITNLYSKMMASERGADAIRAELEHLEPLPLAHSRETTLLQTLNVDCSANEANTYPNQTEAHCRNQNRDVQIDSLRQELAERQKRLDEIQRNLALENADSLAMPVPAQSNTEVSIGGETASIELIEALDGKHLPQNVFHSGDQIFVRACIRAFSPIPAPTFAVRIRNARGVDIFGTNTFYRKTATPDLLAGQQIEVLFKLELNVLAGPYFVSVGCSHFEGVQLVVHHRRYDALEINVLQDDHTFGIANCRPEISTRLLSTEPATGRPAG